jgi:hypothetical protein
MRIEELKRLIAGNGAGKEAWQEELNELEAKYEV